MAVDPNVDQNLHLPSVWEARHDRNPYLHNIFVLLECDPDESERSFDSARKDLGTLVKRGGKEIHGYQVKETDVTTAEEMASQAPKFVAGRLLVHTAHKVSKDQFNEAMKAVELHKLDRPTDHLPLTVRDLTPLSGLFPAPEDVLPGAESRLPKEKLPALFQPSSEDEQILDL